MGNVVRLAVNFISATIVPRSLGPAAYGDFQFITSTSTALRTLMDMGAASAHFTYASKHTRSGRGTSLYFTWLLLQLLVALALIGAAHVGGFREAIWPGQATPLLFIVAGLEWLNYAGIALAQLGDSKAATVRVQTISAIGQLIKAAILAALYVAGRLDLETFIIASYVGSLCIVIGILGWFVFPMRDVYFAVRKSAERLGDVGRYYVGYCAPLAVYAVASFAYDFFDRWFLQKVAGSVQQGFFGLATQWSTLSLLFTTSLINVLWRELSVALVKGDRDRVRTLYVRSVFMAYFIAAAVGCFVAANAADLVTLLAGKDFGSAALVMAMMAMVPLHQSLGQINGTFYFATERVRLYRNVGIGGMMLGMVLTYVALAPATLPVPGLHLGAAGLAAKLILYNVLVGNVFLYYNARYLETPYGPLLYRQVGVLAVLAVAAAAARALAQVVPVGAWGVLLLAGITYAVVVALVVWLYPAVAGLTRGDLKQAANLAARALGRSPN